MATVGVGIDSLTWRGVGSLAPGPDPDPIPDPDPDPDPDPTPDPDPNEPGPGTSYPTSTSQVGARGDVNAYPKVGNITTTHNGQIIEKVWVNGLIRIQHSGVIVRDVHIPFGPSNESNYAIRTEFGGNVGDILIHNVTVAGQPLMNGIRSIAMNFPGVNSGGIRIHHIYVHTVGSGPRFYNNCHIEDSIIQATHYAGSSSHRSGVGNNGGRHCSVKRCWIRCAGQQSSAAISLYGDNDLCQDHEFADNLFETADGYITYGGSVSSKEFPVGEDIRFLRNRYSFVTPYSGPLYGAMTSWAGGTRGNVASGNVWHSGATLNNGTVVTAGQTAV